MNRFVLTAAVVALVASACSSSRDLPAADAVQVFGPYRGAEADALTASFGEFTDRTGIEIAYVGSSDFVDDLRRRVAAGDAPDVAIVPQPALIDEFLDIGVVVPLAPSTRERVEADFALVADVGPHADGRFVVPFRTTIKSLVWFRPDVFESQGWAVPTTLDDLELLVDEIADDVARSPWCLGVRSGVATGWPATDWIEDLMLRSAGSDRYDASVSDLDAAGDDYRAAIELFDQIVGDRDVVGSRRAAPRVDVADAAAPLFRDDGCAMFKQADFALSWMPEDTVVGTDVDVFVLPGVVEGEVPLVVGGDGAVAFTDDIDVASVMDFLASPEAAARWAERGGYLSARTDVEPAEYYHPNSVRLLEVLAEATTVRFDASDQLDVDGVIDEYLPAVSSWLAGATTTDALGERITGLGTDE